MRVYLSYVTPPLPPRSTPSHPLQATDTSTGGHVTASAARVKVSCQPWRRFTRGHGTHCHPRVDISRQRVISRVAVARSAGWHCLARGAVGAWSPSPQHGTEPSRHHPDLGYHHFLSIKMQYLEGKWKCVSRNDHLMSWGSRCHEGE